MDVTRRAVIKGILSGFGLLVLPHIPLESYFKKARAAFNPDYEYSKAFEVTDVNLESEDMKIVLKYIFHTLKRILPQGTPYEIRMMSRDFGIRRAVGWYYGPGMSKKTYNNHKWQYDPQTGCFIWGRFLA